MLLYLKRKNLFAAFAAFIIFSLIFTMLAMAAIIDHDCTGEACPFCMVIKAAVFFLTNTKLAALFIFFTGTIVFLVQRFEKLLVFTACTYSPIILKVRLNT